MKKILLYFIVVAMIITAAWIALLHRTQEPRRALVLKPYIIVGLKFDDSGAKYGYPANAALRLKDGADTNTYYTDFNALRKIGKIRPKDTLYLLTEIIIQPPK